MNKVYCDLEESRCGDRGWALIMKMDGTKVAGIRDQAQQAAINSRGNVDYLTTATHPNTYICIHTDKHIFGWIFQKMSLKLDKINFIYH